MSDSMQQLFANMAAESTLELVGDIQRLKRLVEYTSEHTIKEVREYLQEQVTDVQQDEE